MNVSRLVTIFGCGFAAVVLCTLGSTDQPAVARPAYQAPTSLEPKPSTWSSGARPPDSTGRTARMPTAPNTGVQPLSALDTGIDNGDFEAGSDGSWVEYWDDVDYPIILPAEYLLVTPHGGNWAAWLGGVPGGNCYIAQTVAVPVDSPVLAFWYVVDSEDDVCYGDIAWVAVNNDPVVGAYLCEANNTGGWVQETVDLTAYAGQTIVLQFAAYNNDSLDSHFFLDDITLSGAPGSTTAYLPFVRRDWQGYFDTFIDPTSGWDTDDDEYWRFGYFEGEYQIYIKQPDTGGDLTPNLQLPADYRVEVDARQATSNGGVYGLLFGRGYLNEDVEHYLFHVYPNDGSYALEKHMLDGTDEMLIDWSFASAIDQGTATNHLAVDHIESTITLSVNGTVIATIDDDSFTDAGRDAGIFAAGYEDVPVDMRFDNFSASQR